nr:hypothetical protein [Candidatus Baldrarchaeota archaeon]
MLTCSECFRNLEKDTVENNNKLVRINVFVTKEQYNFLKKLRTRKVAMSTFIRGLLAMYMDTYTSNHIEFIERKTSITITERKTIISKKTPHVKGYGELHQELMKELKQVFMQRKTFNLT